jgi:proteasome lid subunit RPN8/RPN11
LSTSFRLILPRPLYTALLEQAGAELPNECCGLLAGRIEGNVGKVERRYPLVNQLASPREYDAEPRGLFDAARDMRQAGIVELATYHSHPTTDPIPSRTDLERRYGPGVVQLIVSFKTSVPVVRAWWLEEDGFREAEWEVSEIVV